MERDIVRDTSSYINSDRASFGGKFWYLYNQIVICTVQAVAGSK